jgi:Cu/Ag efflux protein CusF
MKKYIAHFIVPPLAIAIITLLAISSLCHAEDKQETMHEVTINIVYNSVNAERANAITSDARKRYGDACKIDISSKKVATEHDSLVFFGVTNSN